MRHTHVFRSGARMASAPAVVALAALIAAIGAQPRAAVAQPSAAAATQPAAAAATAPAATAYNLSPIPVQAMAIDAKHKSMVQTSVNAALAYLLAHQNANGSWGPSDGHPAFTALALKALVQDPEFNVKSPPVAKGLAYLLKYVQPNGGIYDPKIGVANYTTSVAVMALVAAKDESFKPTIEKAVAYLKGLQIVEGSTTPKGEKVDRANPFFGGVSYGEEGRPDLSNLSFAVEALHDAGVPKTDPFFANAVVFLARVQNRSESNDQPWAQVVDDGGFVYATARSLDDLSGESKADEVEVGGRRGLRSYGSMTYSGFKSMLYANVARDDPRVKAAYKWIRRYWRLDSNPNMPEIRSKQGVYYYYHVFAKALRAWGQDVIPDAKDVPHNWRQSSSRSCANSRSPMEAGSTPSNAGSRPCRTW